MANKAVKSISPNGDSRVSRVSQAGCVLVPSSLAQRQDLTDIPVRADDPLPKLLEIVPEMLDLLDVHRSLDNRKRYTAFVVLVPVSILMNKWSHQKLMIVRCRRCRHGGHASHVLEWFRRGNDECPVADCDCNCRADSGFK